MQNNAAGCDVYVSSAIMSRISRHFYMQKLTFYGQIEGSRLAERFAAKTNFETGDEEKTIRSERVRSVMKLMYANTMKMSRTQGRGK